MFSPDEKNSNPVEVPLFSVEIPNLFRFSDIEIEDIKFFILKSLKIKIYSEQQNLKLTIVSKDSGDFYNLIILSLCKSTLLF